MEDEAGGSPRLSLNLPLRSIRTSLLSLSVAADNVTFVVNRSPAQIAAVEVGRLRLPACRLPAHRLASGQPSASASSAAPPDPQTPASPPPQVCTFDGKICGGFEALSTRGYLHGGWGQLSAREPGLWLACRSSSCILRPPDVNALQLCPACLQWTCGTAATWQHSTPWEWRSALPA